MAQTGNPCLLALSIRCVLIDIGDDQWFSVFHNPSRQTLTGLQSECVYVLALFADGDGVIEFLRLFIQHDQRPCVRLEVGSDFLQDGLQNVVEVERGGQSFRDIMKDLQFVGMSISDSRRSSDPIRRNPYLEAFGGNCARRIGRNHLKLCSKALNELLILLENPSETQINTMTPRVISRVRKSILRVPIWRRFSSGSP